jgi:hypothetical protein
MNFTKEEWAELVEDTKDPENQWVKFIEKETAKNEKLNLDEAERLAVLFALMSRRLIKAAKIYCSNHDISISWL